MLARAAHLGRVLHAVFGTDVFRDYCRLRGIPSETEVGPGERGLSDWTRALATAPTGVEARVEMELAQVAELSGRDGNAHLETAGGGGPTPPADVPGGAALALWYLVHREDLFRTVFFHHEGRGARAWRTARTPCRLGVEDVIDRADALGQELQAFLRPDGGPGPSFVVEARRLPGAVCFVVRIAGRPRVAEGFGDGEELVRQRLRPALTVVFTYRPAARAVHLQSPLRSADRVRGLFACFGRAVLRAALSPGGCAFDLDRLKQPFHPLPDAADMVSVRLKALHLRYPARAGRRCVRLETLPGDHPTAMEDLLRAHVGETGPDLRVAYAEIEVRFLIDGRPKTRLVRLWRDRSNLDQSALGERLRSCLERWGLIHA